MPAKASTRTGAKCCDATGIRLSVGMKQRDFAVADAVRQRRRAALPDHDQRIGAGELGGERRAQRAGRDNLAVADAAALPSTTRTEKSFCSDGFWKPSSMTMTLAPAGRAAAAPATRSRATMVGATSASKQRFVADFGRRDGVSGSTCTGPGSLPP